MVTRVRNYFRRNRYKVIRNFLHLENIEGFILDLGGGPASFFAAMFPRPEQVMLVDISPRQAYVAKQRSPSLQVLIADAEKLPLANNAVEATICNSVIEHVNAPEALASEIRRASQTYFLQTPNGEFPLETHSYLAIPFYNYIPWNWLRRLVCKGFKANFEYVSSVRYLSEQRLRSIFPEASVTYEKAFGLKKSFYVYYLNESLK